MSLGSRWFQLASAAAVSAMSPVQRISAASPNRNGLLFGKDYSGERTARVALAAIIAACLFVGIQLFVEVETEWDSLLDILSAAALIGISAIALSGHRQLRPRRVAHGVVAELERAVTVAETASLAKSRYLTNVSHEIRSPLNAIYGYAQLLERDGVCAQEGARIIRRSAEHLTGLIEGLLDIAQVENGLLRVRSDTVSLAPFIEEIVAMMQPAAAAKGLDFVYETTGCLPGLVRMDQSRSRQVLINLLSNAIKFTDTGGIRLRVGYAGQIATFEVIDTGPGIAVADQQRIFDPFERGSDTNQHRQPGAGLGLVISRAIIDILGGQLELESTPGTGSCFRVTLMLGEVTGQLLPETRKDRVSGYDGRRRSILVVEDDFEQRGFLDRLLGGLGFAVVAAPNGETAIELSRDLGIDLAIIDISLPGISGWETAARLRERMGQGIQIVMLSANTQELHRPDFHNPAHDLFLMKPISFEVLTRAIGGLLNLRWIFDEGEGAVRSTAVTKESDPRLSTAALGHVRSIRELLRIGYVRGIETEIHQLAKGTPHESELADHLYVCLDRLDLAGMERMLDQV